MNNTEQLPETDGLVIYEKKAIERVNPLRLKLEALKDTHKDFPELSTTAGMKQAKEQIADFRTLKGEVEKERKEVKSVINRLATTVDESYNSVWEDAEKEQKERAKKVKDFEEEKERLKKENEEKERKTFMSRQADLTAMGAIYSDEHFILGTYAVSATLIGSSPDDVWQNHILKSFKEQFDIIEAERAEEKRLEQERQEKLRQEQEELRLHKEAFEREKAEFEKQQQELEKQKADRQREEDERAAEAARKAQEAIESIRKERLSQLDNYEAHSNGDIFYNGRLVLTAVDLIGFSEHDFNALAVVHNKEVAEDMERELSEMKAEEERIQIEKEKDTIESTRKSMLAAIGITYTTDYNFREMSETDWQNLWDILKADYDKKKHEEWLEMERVKKIQEEEREKERLADLSDGQKWRLWKENLQQFAAEMPDFKSKRYTKMKAIALEKFSEIQLLKAEKISSN